MLLNHIAFISKSLQSLTLSGPSVFLWKQLSPALYLPPNPTASKTLYAQIFPFQAQESSATPAVLSAPTHLSVRKATGWAGCAIIGNKEAKQTG